MPQKNLLNLPYAHIGQCYRNRSDPIFVVLWPKQVQKENTALRMMFIGEFFFLAKLSATKTRTVLDLASLGGAAQMGYFLFLGVGPR